MTQNQSSTDYVLPSVSMIWGKNVTLTLIFNPNSITTGSPDRAVFVCPFDYSTHVRVPAKTRPFCPMYSSICIGEIGLSRAKNIRKGTPEEASELSRVFSKDMQKISIVKLVLGDQELVG